MPFQIYFGEIEVKNIKTGVVKTLPEIIFNDSTNPTDKTLMNQIFARIDKKERENWTFHRFVKNRAKRVGFTNY